MNGRTAKLLRKVANTLGRDPKYIKKYYKAMSSAQQVLYKTYVSTSLENLDKRKEVLHGTNLPQLQQSNSPTGE